jgi:hypothetical protein
MSALAYRSPDVVNFGFAAAPVTMDEVESGRSAAGFPSAGSPNLIAYVRAIGLKAGDVQTLTMRGPDGAVVVRNESQPLESNEAQWLLFIGKRRTTADWPAGLYEAQYQVRRDGATAFTRRFEFQLR